MPSAPSTRWFDVVVVSYEVGLAKPDPRIFELCLSRLGAQAGEALFVDDRAENVAAAERLGLRTLLFTGDDATRRAHGRGTLSPDIDAYH